MDKSEASAVQEVPQMDFEYETEFFGFTPGSVVDSIYNTTMHFVQQTFEAMKKAILKEFPNQITEPEANQAINNIIIVVEKKAEQQFDIMEKYLCSDVFALPSYVVLDSDKIHVESAGEISLVEEAKLQQEIEGKEERIMALLSFNKELREELLEIEETERHYNEFLSLMPTLVSATEKQVKTEADLQATVAQALKDLST